MDAAEQTFDQETSVSLARRVRAQYRRCWRNAALAVTHLGPDALYVEGWVVTDSVDPLVIEHGWCEVEGRIIDPSYAPRISPYEPPVAYYPGMNFNQREAHAGLMRGRLPLAASRETRAYRRAFEAALRDALSRRPREPRPKTRVVHCRREPCDVFIGRPSKWASPYFIGRDGSRETVVARYRRWLMRQPALLRDLESLRGKALGCDCAPLPCHGDVLAELADFGMVDLTTIPAQRELTGSSALRVTQVTLEATKF